MINKSGYILMLTLMIIAMAVALMSVVVQQSFSYQRQTRIAQDKAQARLLALSSLEVVASQLSLVVSKEEDEQSNQQKVPEKRKFRAPDAPEEKEELQLMQRWLLRILPVINRWQTVEFDGADDLEGTMNVYVASEQGKINLVAFTSELKEAEKKQAGPNEKREKTMANSLNALTKAGDKKRGPFAAFDELFKKEKEVSIKEVLKKFITEYERTPEDVSELLRIKPFAKFKESMFMPRTEQKRPLFMMDLFTVAQGKGTINPWLMSRSLKTVLGLTESKERKVTRDFVKNMQPTMQWKTDWDKVLAPLYGKKFAQLDKDVTELFASTFEATAFSVVSYCTVGRVTQRLYALFELTEPGEHMSSKSLIFKISKLYWL